MVWIYCLSYHKYHGWNRCTAFIMDIWQNLWKVSLSASHINYSETYMHLRSSSLKTRCKSYQTTKFYTLPNSKLYQTTNCVWLNWSNLNSKLLNYRKRCGKRRTRAPHAVLTLGYGVLDSPKKGIILKMYFELSPSIVWIVLWIVNTYSEFRVNIFSNNTDITKCQSFCTSSETTPRLYK